MLINVTQKDINEGRKENCFNCPIALAIRNITEKGYLVTKARIVLKNNTELLLPKEAVDFIFKFDNNLKVEPFSFELDI